MPKPPKGKKSRKTRRQLWIGALAGSTMLSGLLFGNAIDANLLATSAKQTLNFDEGWQAFQDHLHHLSDTSAWLGLIFLLFVGFAMPRAYLVARRYFPEIKLFQVKWAVLLISALFVLGGVIGVLDGSLIDRILTETNIVR